VGKPHGEQLGGGGIFNIHIAVIGGPGGRSSNDDALHLLRHRL